MPAAVADIAYHDKATVCDLLFKASSETLMTIAADPKHLGAYVGAISVLHTWGSALTHHPHVHMIAQGAASCWTVSDGSPAGPASFCTCAFFRGCSAVSSSVFLSGGPAFAAGAGADAGQGESLVSSICRLVDSSARAQGLPVSFLTTAILKVRNFEIFRIRESAKV